MRALASLALQRYETNSLHKQQLVSTSVFFLQKTLKIFLKDFFIFEVTFLEK